MTTPNNGGAALAEVLALLAKATPGEWKARPEQAIVILGGNAGGFCIADCPHAGDNSAAICAAVNYLRSHGAAIAELIAADKEYDSARGLVRQTEATYGKRSAAAGRARAALDLANERRALALSNIEGDK